MWRYVHVLEAVAKIKKIHRLLKFGREQSLQRKGSLAKKCRRMRLKKILFTYTIFIVNCLFRLLQQKMVTILNVSDRQACA